MSEIAINSSKKLGFFNSTKALSRSICSRSLPKVFIFSTEEGSRSTKKASGSNRRLTGPRMKKAERQPIVSAAQPPIMGAAAMPPTPPIATIERRQPVWARLNLIETQTWLDGLAPASTIAQQNEVIASCQTFCANPPRQHITYHQLNHARKKME